MYQLTLEPPRVMVLWAVAILGVGVMPAPCPKPCSHFAFVTLGWFEVGSFTSSLHPITGIPPSSLIHWFLLEMLRRKHSRAGGRWEDGGGHLLLPNFLKAWLEASPKSAAGSNLGAPHGLKLSPRAQSPSLKQNLEPGSLDRAPEMQCRGGPTGLGPLLCAVTLSFLGPTPPCAAVSSSHLQTTQLRLREGKLHTQRHTASQGHSYPSEPSSVWSQKLCSFMENVSTENILDYPGNLHLFSTSMLSTLHVYLIYPSQQP